MTQLERARENEVTPEMKFVAAREDLPEDLVCRGRSWKNGDSGEYSSSHKMS